MAESADRRELRRLQQFGQSAAEPGGMRAEVNSQHLRSAGALNAPVSHRRFG